MEEQQTQSSIFDDIKAQYYFRPASAGARFGNYFIDSICIRLVMYLLQYFFSFVLGIIVKNFYDPDTYQYYVYSFALFNLLVGILLYYTLLEGITGKTIGKLVTRTKVIRTDGSPITMKDTLLRSLSRLVPFEAFSAFNEYPWHDRWTKTIVMKESDFDEFKALESL